VLKTASRILALRDGDGGWFGDLEASLAIALQAAPAATAGSGSTRIPAAATGTGDFVRALRARLDALPLEERSQATPVDLMLLARARSPVEKEMLVERLRASKNRLAIPFLYELAMNGDANLRVLAAIALTDLGDYTAKEALREALRSGAVDRRRAAVQAVAKSFEPDDLEDLRTAATRDPDPAVRTEAALLVADREADSSVLAALHTALTDNDDEVKVRAAVALGKHGDRAGVPVLQSLLKARRGPVQVRAADALYELGDPSGLMVLLESRRREGGSSFLSTVRLVVGNIYMLLEDDRSALLEYRSILSFDREFDKAHANIGRLYYLRKRDRAAIAALDRALALNPFLAGAQIYRGLARARSGDVRGGLRDVEEALAKDPTSKLAALAKAEILVRRGEHEAAERVLGDALRRWPLHAPSFHHAARLRMGEAGREFANLSLAEELARKAVQLRPEDPSYLHTLAEIYEAQGRREQALRAAKRALHHSIGDPMRARMRKLVDRLSQQPPLDAAGRTTSAPPE
jgi:tetratricopeptide (TPR) repeat protein